MLLEVFLNSMAVVTLHFIFILLKVVKFSPIELFKNTRDVNLYEFIIVFVAGSLQFL